MREREESYLRLGREEVLRRLSEAWDLSFTDGSTFHKIPAYIPKEVVNATGAGDTYMTGYLYNVPKAQA